MNYLCQWHIIENKRRNQRFSKIVISTSFIHKTLGEIQKNGGIKNDLTRIY